MFVRASSGSGGGGEGQYKTETVVATSTAFEITTGFKPKTIIVWAGYTVAPASASSWIWITYSEELDSVHQRYQRNDGASLTQPVPNSSAGYGTALKSVDANGFTLNLDSSLSYKYITYEAWG